MVYEYHNSQTVTLMRLQKTCDVLRKIIRILQLSKKLQNQEVSGEITKAAASLNELMELWQPEDELNGIEIIEQDQRAIIKAKNEVEKNADTLLKSGMESKSQNQMGVALQVFFNLNILNDKVKQVQSDLLKEIKIKAAELLDGKKINSTFVSEESSKPKNAPGRSNRALSSVPTSANLSAFRSLLWTNVECLLEFTFNKMTETMQLQKILVKKRDIVLGMNFIELLDDQNIVEHIWNEIIAILKKSFQQSSADSSTIKQCFEGEFPKLIRFFNDLWSRLCQTANNSIFSSPETNLILNNPFEKLKSDDLRQVLVTFERQYLSRSLSRLFDPVNLMFSGEAPKSEELDQVFRAINSEVAIAQVDNILLSTVIRNVSKTAKLMCAKCEQMMESQASQVVGYPTNEQRKNVDIVNCLFAFYQGVEHHLMDQHLESLDEIGKLIKNSIQPLIISINDAIEAILLTMHSEDFDQVKEVQKTSPYLRELQTFVARVYQDFLSKFHCKNLVAEICSPLVLQTLDFFIIQASLIRPISEQGVKKLIFDIDNLEPALGPLMLVSIDTKELSSFRILLETPSEEFPMKIQDLRFKSSIALQMLFARAPPEMKHPHDSVGWSISRYSTWLNSHIDEQDRLQFIQGALESYVASTRARKEKSYAFPYNIMLNILQEARK